MTREEAEGPAGLRREILRLVQRYPGLHTREVERQLGVSAQLAAYHLRELGRQGWLAEEPHGGFTRWFPGPRARSRFRLSERERRLLGALRGEVALETALLLLEHGAVPHGELARRLGRAPSTLSYHLARMEQAGLVRRAADRIELADPALVDELLMRYEPVPTLLDRFREMWDDLYG